jgi:hypothetical protein
MMNKQTVAPPPERKEPYLRPLDIEKRVELKLSYLHELNSMQPVIAADGKQLNESIQSLCRSIANDLGVGEQQGCQAFFSGESVCAIPLEERLRNGRPVGVAYAPPLAAPPTIKDRLMAAIYDQSSSYMAVHYNRREGATTAAIEIGREQKGVFIMSRPNIRNLYSGVAWLNCEGKHQDMFEGREIRTIITDAIPEKTLMDLLLYLRSFDIKVVALKPNFPK